MNTSFDSLMTTHHADEAVFLTLQHEETGEHLFERDFNPRLVRSQVVFHKICMSTNMRTVIAELQHIIDWDIVHKQKFKQARATIDKEFKHFKLYANFININNEDNAKILANARSRHEFEHQPLNEIVYHRITPSMFESLYKHKINELPFDLLEHGRNYLFRHYMKSHTTVKKYPFFAGHEFIKRQEWLEVSKFKKLYCIEADGNNIESAVDLIQHEYKILTTLCKPYRKIILLEDQQDANIVGLMGKDVKIYDMTNFRRTLYNHRICQ